MSLEQLALRRIVIDWLDDNIHFGEAEAMIGGDDDLSMLKNGILDSLGYVMLILYLEKTCNVRLDPKKLSPSNFDSLRKVVEYVSAMPGFRLPVN